MKKNVAGKMDQPKTHNICPLKKINVSHAT